MRVESDSGRLAPWYWISDCFVPWSSVQITHKLLAKLKLESIEQAVNREKSADQAVM